MKAKVFAYTPGYNNVEEFEKEINDWLLNNQNIKINNVVNGRADNYGWGNGDRFIVIYIYE